MTSLDDQITKAETAMRHAAATGHMSDFHDAYAHLQELKFQQAHATMPRTWTDGQGEWAQAALAMERDHAHALAAAAQLLG